MVPISDIVAAALGGSAGRLLDPTIRKRLDTLLAEHGYGSPEEMTALRGVVGQLQSRVRDLDARLADLDGLVRELEDEETRGPVKGTNG
ncbi:MAG: hypothetical protein QGG40_14270 [Myxococcota bacterium]|nr:hypothetical protein [Myxococcota bacterium]